MTVDAQYVGNEQGILLIAGTDAAHPPAAVLEPGNEFVGATG